MKRKIIRIAIAVLVIAVIILVAFGFTSRTIIFDGTMLEDGNESNVTISIKQRRIDALVDKLYGSLCIQTKDEEILFDYYLLGPVSIWPDRNLRHASITGYDKDLNRMDSASLFFDAALKNIIIIADGDVSMNQPRREYYSADSAFRALVKEVE